MIEGVGHLGIAVKDIEKSLDALSQIINFERPAIKEFPEKKMTCAVVEVNGVALEFLHDKSEDGSNVETETRRFYNVRSVV